MFTAAKGVKYSFAYMDNFTEESRITTQYPDASTIHYEGMEKKHFASKLILNKMSAKFVI